LTSASKQAPAVRLQVLHRQTRACQGTANHCQQRGIIAARPSISSGEVVLGIRGNRPRYREIYREFTRAGISDLLLCAPIGMMVPQMSPDNHRPDRTWQEIAAEASREKDPKKLMELTEELERALEERDAKPGLDRKSVRAPE